MVQRTKEIEEITRSDQANIANYLNFAQSNGNLLRGE